MRIYGKRVEVGSVSKFFKGLLCSLEQWEKTEVKNGMKYIN